MKASKIFIIVLLALFIFKGVGLTQKDTKDNENFPVLRGPYLGQKPPGDVPELFAPGIVSSVYWEHSGAVFTPDGKELFWSRAINEGRTPRIIVVLRPKPGSLIKLRMVGVSPGCSD